MRTIQREVRTIRRKKVRDLTGLSASQIDRLEAANQFPRRVHLSIRAVGWVESEISDWIGAKIEERDLRNANGEAA